MERDFCVADQKSICTTNFLYNQVLAHFPEVTQALETYFPIHCQIIVSSAGVLGIPFSKSERKKTKTDLLLS